MRQPSGLSMDNPLSVLKSYMIKINVFKIKKGRIKTWQN